MRFMKPGPPALVAQVERGFESSTLHPSWSGQTSSEMRENTSSANLNSAQIKHKQGSGMLNWLLALSVLLQHSIFSYRFFTHIQDLWWGLQRRENCSSVLSYSLDPDAAFLVARCVRLLSESGQIVGMQTTCSTSAVVASSNELGLS